jgi:hypothetical protein
VTCAYGHLMRNIRGEKRDNDGLDDYVIMYNSQIWIWITNYKAVIRDELVYEVSSKGK